MQLPPARLPRRLLVPRFFVAADCSEPPLADRSGWYVVDASKAVVSPRMPWRVPPAFFTQELSLLYRLMFLTTKRRCAPPTSPLLASPHTGTANSSDPRRGVVWSDGDGASLVIAPLRAAIGVARTIMGVLWGWGLVHDDYWRVLRVFFMPLGARRAMSARNASRLLVIGGHCRA